MSGIGDTLSQPMVGGLKGWQLIALGGVGIALLLYLRSRGKGSGGTTILQPAQASTGSPFLGMDSLGGITPPSTVPPIGGPTPPPSTNPPPDQSLNPPVVATPATAANVADTITKDQFLALGQQFPAYASPGLAAMFPNNGVNFPFSQTAQRDCGSNQTFVNASVGCVNNDAYARMNSTAPTTSSTLSTPAPAGSVGTWRI